MTSVRRPGGVCVLTPVVVLAVVGVLAAQDSEQREAPEARLRRAAQHMKQFEMQKGGEKKDAEPKKRDVVELVAKPLLTYGDSARLNENGTLWAFGKVGRPLAFLELYQGTGRDSRWVHAITLTSKELVLLRTPAAARWTPQETQIDPSAIADAPAPDVKENVRLRQMKDLARRFTAHEFWDPDNSRFELRLLVQPVHRYADADSRLHDGAAFVLAHDTNPEIVLLIEALGDKQATARWHFSAARLGSAELHLQLDGKEVWKRTRTPGVVGRATDPYWLFFSPVTRDE